MKPVPEQVLFRFVWPWQVFAAIPTTVVEQTAERTVLWIRPGTSVRWPRGARLPIPELAKGGWKHEEAEWYGGRLMISEPGIAHSVYVSWGRDGEFVGWYVNLEDPWRARPFGFDTTDHLLDIVVDPDRSWRWKDEDHLAEAVEVGLFTPEQALSIRAEGERSIERIQSWSPPFDEGWERWRPDPTWPVPKLASEWNRLDAAGPSRRSPKSNPRGQTL